MRGLVMQGPQVSDFRAPEFAAELQAHWHGGIRFCRHVSLPVKPV
jgi:hypothetical protein